MSEPYASFVPRSSSMWVSCPGCKAHMQSEPKLITKLRDEAKAQGKTISEVAVAYFDNYHLAVHGSREGGPEIE